MPVYRIKGETWGTELVVLDGVVIEANEALEWTLGFDWVHVKEYFDQYGYHIESSQRSM